MKKLIKKLYVTALILLLILPTNLQAANMTLTTYYPALSGEYDRLQLLPRSVNLTNNCTIGTLYVNSTNILQYCHPNGMVGNWGPITDAWTQNGDDIYPTDTLTEPNLHVGIGTKTPEFKLSIQDDAGIIAHGTFGSGNILPGLTASSRLIWYPRKAAFRAGYVSGNHWDDSNTGVYSSAFGKDSIASGAYSVVGGGDTNTASGDYSSVIGGQNNTASGDYSSIIGGDSNTATQQYTIVTGGQSNNATANYATVLGGQNNQSEDIYSTVSGGTTNQVQTPYSNINGGFNNLINYTGTSGSKEGFSIIGGGKDNQIHNNYSIISGGESNTVGGPYSSIGGGFNNTTQEAAGVIGTSSYVRISGGENNLINAGNQYSVISGGRNNTITGSYDMIGGGWQNSTQATTYSSIAGGERNTTTGSYSTILGGIDNKAFLYSWINGRNMQSSNTAARTFVWGYSETPVSITTADAFIIASGTILGIPWNPKVGIRDIDPKGVLEINANGTTSDEFIYIKKTGSPNILLNIRLNNSVPIKKTYIGINRLNYSSTTHVMQIGTDSSNGNGAFLTEGGSWSFPSSRKLKENIHPLTSEKAQNALDQLDPVTFKYKVSTHPNIGFIAEDVPEIVAMPDRKSLSSLDIIAVLTKVSQDQEQMIEKQKIKIKSIRAEIETLKKLLNN